MAERVEHRVRALKYTRMTGEEQGGRLRRARFGPIATVAIALCCFASCTAAPTFFNHAAIEITAPKEMSVIAPPILIAWQPTRLPRAAAAFAVFVDRLPMRPAQNLRALTNDSCKRTPGCPDDNYLRTIGVFRTKADRLVLPSVGRLGGFAGKDKPSVHQVTIALIDARGYRLGEQASTVSFRVPDTGL